MKYKIVISEINEKEVPETEYTNTGKKNKEGEAIWEYVKTGRTKISREENEVYVQELKELNIGDLACYINRVR